MVGISPDYLVHILLSDGASMTSSSHSSACPTIDPDCGHHQNTQPSIPIYIGVHPAKSTRAQLAHCPSLLEMVLQQASASFLADLALSDVQATCQADPQLCQSSSRLSH